MDVTFHLVPKKYFDSLDPKRDYAPRDLAREGFIHCTDGAEEMAKVANEFYKPDSEPHYYLYIDKARVRAPIRYHDALEIYPHICGALNRDAIVAVRTARRDANGNFSPPEKLSSTITTERPSAFIALQYPDFRLIWIGQLVSQAGSQMQMTALNYHVYLLTHDAVALGLTSLARLVPILIFSLLGGVFADARDRRRVLLVTQSILMLTAFALGVFTFTQTISVAIIYSIAALNAATQAFDSPARQSLAPNLVPKEHLTNALSLNNIVHQTAGIVGPALGGLLIGIAGDQNEATIGVGAVYFLNSASFLAVLIALALIKTPTQQNLGAAKITLDSLAEGIHFVRGSKIILSTMLLDFIATFFSSATSLLPIFAKEILNVGSEGYGLLNAAESVGAVIAGAAMARMSYVRRKGQLILWAVAVYGLGTTLYGFSQWFALSLLFLGLVGAADTVSTIMRNTLRQMATPDQLRGRMTSVNMIFFSGGPQLGNLEAGLVAAWIGAPLSVITGGVATVIAVAATAWLVPQLREYSDQ